MKKRSRWSRRLLRSAALSLSLVVAVVARAGAEVQVAGTADDVVLRARNATLIEVLSGIHATLGSGIAVTGSTERRFTGDYAGSLRHVLSRLLEGEDYIIGWAPNGMRIAILGHRGAAQPARLAAVDRVATNSVQGWAADINPFAKSPHAVPAQPADAAQPLRLATNDDEPSNLVQGWTGSATPFAKFAAAASAATSGPANAVDAAATQPMRLAANDDEPGSPVQGWMGTAKPFVKPAAAASVAAPAPANSVDAAAPQAADTVKPQVDETEPQSASQGWEPTQNPFKDVPIRRAPVATDAAAASSRPDEGNPNFQGYMLDWSPSQRAERAIPTLPAAAAIGVPR